MENVADIAGTENEVEPTEPKVVKIHADNPSPEEMKALIESIKVNYDFNVNVKPVQFKFKKSKDKETGIETVREAVELAIPFPSVEGIIAILEAGGKQLELLMDAVESVVTSVARDIISEDVTINAENFPVEKLSWEAIANMPKATRRGGGIPKETWEAFERDYIEVMPGATGKTLEQVTKAAALLKNKFNACKTNLDVLNLLVDQLAIYAENSPNAEEFGDVIAFLLQKADNLLNTQPEELLAAL